MHASAVKIKAMWPPAWKQKDDEQKRHSYLFNSRAAASTISPVEG